MYSNIIIIFFSSIDLVLEMEVKYYLYMFLKITVDNSVTGGQKKNRIIYFTTLLGNKCSYNLNCTG